MLNYGLSSNGPALIILLLHDFGTTAAVDNNRYMFLRANDVGLFEPLCTATQWQKQAAARRARRADLAPPDWVVRAYRSCQSV